MKKTICLLLICAGAGAAKPHPKLKHALKRTGEACLAVSITALAVYAESRR